MPIKALSREEMERRMRKCYAAKIDRNVLPEDFTAWIQMYSDSFMIPWESVLSALIINAACICSDSTTKITNQYRESLSLYMVMVGQSGTNKSTAIRLAKKAMLGMEKFFEDHYLKKKSRTKMAFR